MSFALSLCNDNVKLGLLLPPPPGVSPGERERVHKVLSRTLLQDGPEVEELDDVDVGELLALDAHVDRVQRARPAPQGCRT